MSKKEKWTAQQLINCLDAYFSGYGTIGEEALREIKRRLLEQEIRLDEEQGIPLGHVSKEELKIEGMEE